MTVLVHPENDVEVEFSLFFSSLDRPKSFLSSLFRFQVKRGPFYYQHLVGLQSETAIHKIGLEFAKQKQINIFTSFGEIEAAEEADGLFGVRYFVLEVFEFFIDSRLTDNVLMEMRGNELQISDAGTIFLSFDARDIFASSEF